MAKNTKAHIPSGPFRHRSKHRRVITHATSVRSQRDGGTFAMSLGGNQTTYRKRNKTGKELVA